MDKYLTREKLLGVHKHPHFPFMVLLIGIILFADLIFLNYKILSKNSEVKQGVSIQSDQDKKENPTQETSITKGEDSCGTNCMNQINEAVSKALSAKNKTAPASSGGSSQVKEYFIPLGSSLVSSTSWQNVPGLQASIDGSAYGNIQTATFEISVNVPTGNLTAEFQLYNSTANHPVWNSNVTFTGGGQPQLLISSPISLDPGINTYIVQAINQLPYPAYISQARVHIITN